jgi:NAD(P)-dependent dehydrogenase (short-subunit alcohol dehydrogenase family)
MGALAGKVVVVTGAAGNLGVAVARAAAAAGARLALVGRDGARLLKAFPGEDPAAGRLIVGGVDMTDAATTARAIDGIVAHFGRLDGIVHTVGGWAGGRGVDEAEPGDFEAMLAINFTTALNVCRATVPHLRRAGAGSIVTVAARGGLAGAAGNAPYAVGKAALLRLTESLSEENKKYGVTVNAVLPGTIDTPQNRDSMPDADHSRWVPPAAIADVVVFLLSPAARAVTGAAIPVYGRG